MINPNIIAKSTNVKVTFPVSVVMAKSISLSQSITYTPYFK